MTMRMLAVGCADASGVYVRNGDGYRPIAELTPLGEAVREACAAILAGEVKPCRWCDSIAPCDCLRWHEYMLLDPDPHGDLSVFQDCDIPL